MNKYQEALDHIIKCDREDGGISYLSDAYRNDISALQELVNRATPKKPIYKINRIGDYEYVCSSCGERFPYTINCIDQHMYVYCPYCGQKADWSDK